MNLFKLNVFLGVDEYDTETIYINLDSPYKAYTDRNCCEDQFILEGEFWSTFTGRLDRDYINDYFVIGTSMRELIEEFNKHVHDLQHRQEINEILND